MPSRDARRYLLWWSAGTWGRWSLTHHQRSSRHSVKISHMEGMEGLEGMEEMEGMEGAWGQKDALLQFERCWRVWTQKLSPSILVPCLTWALDCFPFHCWVVRHHTSGPKMIRKRNLCAAVVPSTRVFRCSIEGSRVCLSWMSKTHPSPQRGKLQKVLGAQSGGPWNLVCFGLFRFAFFEISVFGISQAEAGSTLRRFAQRPPENEFRLCLERNGCSFWCLNWSKEWTSMKSLEWTNLLEAK